MILAKKEEGWTFLVGGQWYPRDCYMYYTELMGYSSNLLFEVIAGWPPDMGGLLERQKAIVRGDTGVISKAERFVMKLSF